MAGLSAINVFISFRFRFLNSAWSVIMVRQSASLIASFMEFAFLAPKLWSQ